MTTASAQPPVIVGSSTRYWVLLGAIIVQLILGTVYGFSIFWQPLQAKIFPMVVTQAEADAMVLAGKSVEGMEVVADAAAARVMRDTQSGYLKYAFSICILSFAVVMVIAGRVQDVKGPRFTATIGAVLMGMGFIIAGLMNHFIVFYLAHAAFIGAVTLLMLMGFYAVVGNVDQKSMPVLQHVPMAIVAACVVAGVMLGNRYVGQLGELDKLFMLWGTVGFMAGAGIGFAYVCPIAALIKWFPTRKGLVSGIAVAGFGFGAYLFKGRTFGGLGFIERYDIMPFFVVHGLVCLIGITGGAMLLRNPPAAPATAGSKAAADSSWHDTLRQPAFYVLWLMYFSGSMAGLMVIGIIMDFAGGQLVAAALREAGTLADSTRAELILRGAEAVGWLAIFNAIGRIAWGFASDWIGRTLAFIFMFIFQAVIMFALAGLDTELSIAVGASIVGFNYGGIFALFPSATADLFGSKNLGANYGWLFTSYGVAGVAGIVLGNAAKVMTDSYAGAFNLAAVLCLISAGLAIVLRRMARKAKAA